MTKYLTILAVIGTLAVSACAQSPSAIQPVSMTGAYDGISCSRAKADLAAQRETLRSLSEAQRSAVAGDAFGVFLIGVPVSSLTGGDRAGDIATAKGKVLALEQKVARC